MKTTNIRSKQQQVLNALFTHLSYLFVSWYSLLCNKLSFAVVFYLFAFSRSACVFIFTICQNCLQCISLLWLFRLFRCCCYFCSNEYSVLLCSKSKSIIFVHSFSHSNKCWHNNLCSTYPYCLVMQGTILNTKSMIYGPKTQYHLTRILTGQ